MLSKNAAKVQAASDEQSEQNEPSSVMVGVDEHGGRVVMNIKGQIMSPAMYSSTLFDLRSLSTQYDTCVVYLNSGGGDVSTMTEILDILKTYKTVITIGSGVIGSAAFMIWASGDVRVVSPSTLLLIHREGYDFRGRTPQHVEFAEINQRIFVPIFQKFVEDGIMTESEKDDAGKTDVYYTGEQMINGRKVAISFDAFTAADRNPPAVYTRSFLDIDGVEYELIDGTYGILDGGETPVNIVKEYYNSFTNPQAVSNQYVRISQ